MKQKTINETRQYAVIVHAVYGFKVILCNSNERATQRLIREKYAPEAFGFVSIAVGIEKNTRQAKVKIKSAQYDRLAMLKETKRGYVVVLYDDGYQLSRDLIRPSKKKRHGAIVFNDY